MWFCIPWIIGAWDSNLRRGQDGTAQEGVDASRAGSLAVCLELPRAILLTVGSWGLAGHTLTIVTATLQQGAWWRHLILTWKRFPQSGLSDPWHPLMETQGPETLP